MRLFAVTLAVTTLLAFWTPPVRASTTIPIRMSGTIHDSPTPDPGCGGLHNVSTGRINGTPFGASGWSSIGCIDAVQEPGVLKIHDARFVVKGAGGTVSGTYTGHTSLPSSSGHLYGWGQFTITRGTGRYKGVRGSGIFASQGDIPSASARFEMSGTMRR